MGGGKRPNGVPWCRPPPAEDVLPVPYLRLWRSLPTDLDGLEIASLKLQMEEMNRNLTRVLQTNQQVNTVTPSCETCGGPHSYNDCPATVGQNQNVYAVGAYNQGGNSYQPQGYIIKMNTASSSGTGSLPSNTVANPKGKLKAITTQSGLVLDGPSVPIPPPFINLEEDERA
ncbi:hypothetical protein Tco_0066717 [Tanacetum coccineum]